METWRKVLTLATVESKLNFSNSYSTHLSERTEKRSGNEDMHVARAYYYAFRDVRLRYGLCGNFKIDGSEVDALSELTVKIIGYEVSNALSSSIPDGMSRDTISTTVQQHVVQVVEKIVKQTWYNASMTCASLRSATDRQVKAIVSPLKHQQVIIKECIVESVQSMVNKFVTECTTKLCKPFLSVAAAPIAKAYAVVVRSIYVYLTEKYVTDSDALLPSGNEKKGLNAVQRNARFIRFIEETHVAIDCDWMPMMLINFHGERSSTAEDLRELVGKAENFDPTRPSTSELSSPPSVTTSDASLMPRSSTSLGNLASMHTTS